MLTQAYLSLCHLLNLKLTIIYFVDLAFRCAS